MKRTGIHKTVTIGEGVRIGTNVTILPGATIYNNAIVVAGAVVTKDVKEREVVMGPYAEVKRKRNYDN